MSNTYSIVGWLSEFKKDAVYDDLVSLFDNLSVKEAREDEIKQVIFSHSDLFDKAIWASENFILTFDSNSKPNTICRFELYMTSFGSASILTSSVILNVVQRIFNVIKPIFALSVNNASNDELKISSSLKIIIENLTGLCYISRNLSRKNLFEDKGFLYRVNLCDDGYLISSPFGIGNEAIYYLFNGIDKYYLDESLLDLLHEANQRHTIEIKSILENIGIFF